MELLNQNKKLVRWLKPSIDMNTKLRNDSEKYFFNLMNNALLEKKNRENVRKHGDIKLVITKAWK